MKLMCLLLLTGGRICIVSRSNCFDGKTVPEYENIVPLMKEMEATGKWRNLKWEIIPDYTGYIEGVLIVYEVL